MINVDLYSA